MYETFSLTSSGSSLKYRRALKIFVCIVICASFVTVADTVHAAGKNLIPNPQVENGTTNPSSWSRGGYGVNTRSFTYPITGSSGRGVRTEITTYQSGDAKWYFGEIATRGATTFEYSDKYRSNTTSYVTVQFTKSDGTHSYQDIGKLAPSTSWTPFNTSFTVPSAVTRVTVFHLIKSVGYLETDAFSLATTTNSTTFSKGYVSLNFDDGWKETYNNAFPILNAKGFKATSFIVTDRLKQNDFPGYIKASDVLAMQEAGHEIGAHTKTHANLVALSSAAAKDEIEGSRNALLAIGAKPVNYFAYPFGAYNASIEKLVKNAGFVGARSSDGGYNSKTTNPLALKRQPMVNTTTFADAKRYIDTARKNKTWVVLLFHEVSDNGDAYSVSPELFSQIVDYLDTIHEKPITMRQGFQYMSQ